jgi:hypothetical protein
MSGSENSGLSPWQDPDLRLSPFIGRKGRFVSYPFRTPRAGTGGTSARHRVLAERCRADARSAKARGLSPCEASCVALSPPGTSSGGDHGMLMPSKCPLIRFGDTDSLPIDVCTPVGGQVLGSSYEADPLSPSMKAVVRSGDRSGSPVRLASRGSAEGSSGAVTLPRHGRTGARAGVTFVRWRWTSASMDRPSFPAILAS